MTARPINPNMVISPAPYVYAPYPSDGTQQQCYGSSPYKMPSRPDSMSDSGQEPQGSMLGFPQGHVPMNFPQSSPWPWNMNIPSPGSVPLEPSLVSQGGANNDESFPGGKFPVQPPHLTQPHMAQTIQRVGSYSDDSNPPDPPPSFCSQPES